MKITLEAKRRADKRVDELGLDRVQLAKKIKTSYSTLWNFLKGETYNFGRLPELAKELQVSVDWFFTDKENEQSGMYKNSITNLKVQPKDDMSDFSFGPDLVPIVGYANATSSAIVLNYDAPIGETLRHPTQRGVKNAFLVKIVDDTMIPRYFPEEFGVVKGGMGPLPDGDCLIETIEGEGYVKKFLRRTAKEIICEQYNPPKQWKIPSSKVKALHAISGRQSHI